MKKIKLLFYAASIAVFFAACSGKEGAPGATGPQGNANVKSTSYSVNTPAGWTYAAPYWYATFNDGQLTADIGTNGAVEVFVSTDGGTSWGAMPNSQPTGTAGLNIMWAYGYIGSNVTVEFSYSDGAQHNDPNTYYAASCSFRVVCIAASAIKANPNTNWKNYAEVQRVLNLKN